MPSFLDDIKCFPLKYGHFANRRQASLPSIKTDLFMDDRHLFGLPSIKNDIFMDGDKGQELQRYCFFVKCGLSSQNTIFAC